MPPLPREVLDSEDEDDLVPLKPRSPVATSHSGEDAPLDTLMDVDQATSTASTAEQLRLAHKALMEPTQDVFDVVNPAVSIPLQGSHKRRALNSDRDPEPGSAGKLKRIKVATNGSSSHSVELTAPGPTYPDPTSTPIVGTSDTIPGETFPPVSTSGKAVDKKTPTTRTRKSSQQHASSAEHTSNLTPWSPVSAVVSSDRLNSDDAAIGLPKEMYIPRPTRRRSTQVELAPMDYYKIPGKTSKKVKRASTDTKEASSTESMFPSRPILEAPAIEGMSPPPPSLNTNQTPLQDTVAETPSEILYQEPPASSKPQKSVKKATKTKQPAKRGRPKKQVVVEEEDDDDLAIEDEIAVAKPGTPEPGPKPQVQVLISPSKSKPVLSDVVMHENDPELINKILAGLESKKPAETAPQLAPAPERPTKKGRKGKAPKTEAKEVPAIPDAVDEDLLPTQEIEVPEEKPVPSPGTIASKLVPNLDMSDKLTSQTAKKATPKTSPSRPSWQRTPYRVGLSRSQRIPSLLKVFKK